MFTRCIIVSSSLIVLTAAGVAAAVPPYVQYQGCAPGVANGAYEARVEFYDAQTGGTLLMTDVHSSVTVSEGRFAVSVGAGSGNNGIPSDVLEHAEVWIEVTVAGVPVEGGRIRLFAVPYALEARAAEQLSFDADTQIRFDGSNLAFFTPADASAQMLMSATQDRVDIQADLNVTGPFSAPSIVSTSSITANGGFFVNGVQAINEYGEAVRSQYFVSVTDFDATGYDTSDDTTAFNDALATGAFVFVPKGTYYIDGTIIMADGGGLIGEGFESEVYIHQAIGPGLELGKDESDPNEMVVGAVIANLRFTAALNRGTGEADPPLLQIGRPHPAGPPSHAGTRLEHLYFVDCANPIFVYRGLHTVIEDVFAQRPSGRFLQIGATVDTYLNAVTVEFQNNNNGVGVEFLAGASGVYATNVDVAQGGIGWYFSGRRNFPDPLPDFPTDFLPEFVFLTQCLADTPAGLAGFVIDRLKGGFFQNCWAASAGMRDPNTVGGSGIEIRASLVSAAVGGKLNVRTERTSQPSVQSVSFDHCQFVHNDWRGVAVGRAGDARPFGVSFNNCLFAHNGAASAGAEHLLINKGDEIAVVNCRFLEIVVGGNAPARCIVVGQSAGDYYRIQNNRFSNFTAADDDPLYGESYIPNRIIDGNLPANRADKLAESPSNDE